MPPKRPGPRIVPRKRKRESSEESQRSISERLSPTSNIEETPQDTLPPPTSTLDQNEEESWNMLFPQTAVSYQVDPFHIPSDDPNDYPAIVPSYNQQEALHGVDEDESELDSEFNHLDKYESAYRDILEEEEEKEREEIERIHEYDRDNIEKYESIDKNEPADSSKLTLSYLRSLLSRSKNKEQGDENLYSGITNPDIGRQILSSIYGTPSYRREQGLSPERPPSLSQFLDQDSDSDSLGSFR